MDQIPPIVACWPKDGTPRERLSGAAGTIRWGYYVTYNPDSLASLKANIDNLTHVSPYYYSLKADGTIADVQILFDNTLDVAAVAAAGPRRS